VDGFHLRGFSVGWLVNRVGVRAGSMRGVDPDRMAPINHCIKKGRSIMKEARIVLVMLFSVFLILSGTFCEGESRYADGVYEGEHSFVKVQVTVKDGSVTDIKMLHHGGGGEKYAEMVKPLLPEMVKKQSTDIDAVTGATVSSDNLKKAVDNALENATF